MYNVYRHLDKNEGIIYIGKSKNLLSRQRNHRDNSSWFDDINKIEYMNFCSKIEMDVAELYLINKYTPINNKKDNRGDDVGIVTINENWSNFDMSELKIKNKSKPKCKITDNRYIKPNFLINIDRNNISSTMIECMDKMLHFSQLYIRNIMNENFKIEDLKDNKYKISAEYILGSRTRGNLPFMIEQIKSMSKIDIKCIDKNYNLGIVNVFKNLEYIAGEDVFEYTLSNDINISLYNGNNIIGEPESSPYFSDMSYKYKLDLDLKNDKSYHMLEYYTSFIGLMDKKGGSHTQIVDIDTFKDMIGVNRQSYGKIFEFKRKVIKPIMDKMEHDYNSPIFIEVLGGKGKDKKIKIVYMRSYLNPKLKIEENTDNNINKQYDDDFIDYQYDNYILPDGFGVK